MNGRMLLICDEDIKLRHIEPVREMRQTPELFDTTKDGYGDLVDVRPFSYFDEAGQD